MIQVYALFISHMSWFFTNLIAALLLPPLNLLLLSFCGALLYKRFPRIARTLLISSFVALWLLSTPYFSESMLQSLESANQPVNTKFQSADAIIVLGGGSYFAPEYDEDTIGGVTLERVRYGAKLFRETGKPVLLTGGKPQGNSTSEAQQMEKVMQEEFNIPIKWTENESNNTAENAMFSHALLQQYKINRVYLVTHAWHMPRAARIFKRAGFEVIPAPTSFSNHTHVTLLDFIPNAGALQNSNIFIHELIGQLWYRLKYGQ